VKPLIWGQPIGAVSQFAYFVPDLRLAIASYVDPLRVGPWYVLEHFQPVEMRYRGSHTAVDVSLALAFSGQMSIELVQQHNDVPSVYRDGMKGGSRFGFHHFGVATDDFDGEMARYTAKGYSREFEAIVADGARIAYMDGPDLHGMVEIIEATAGVEEIYGMIFRAAQGWDGQDPFRLVG
jgi:Glyoxalase/Bleomycin resistance protein/Dioxygenase superfamily